MDHFPGIRPSQNLADQRGLGLLVALDNPSGRNRHMALTMLE